MQGRLVVGWKLTETIVSLLSLSSAPTHTSGLPFEMGPAESRLGRARQHPDPTGEPSRPLWLLTQPTGQPLAARASLPPLLSPTQEVESGQKTLEQWPQATLSLLHPPALPRAAAGRSPRPGPG